MKQSLSYYITLWAIKLKGIKKTFSQDPIDFHKVRTEDMHKPRGRFFSKHLLRTFKILESKITEVGIDHNSTNLILFLHGGAYISGPVQHHWDTMQKIALTTQYKVWMCNYPKAPEYSIEEISKNIDAIYAEALNNSPSHQIQIIGDSVGAGLSIALVQRLIRTRTELPAKIILISPVVDASLSNPNIETLEEYDPLLSKVGALSAKKMCARNMDLKNPMISPLYGSFDGFPPTVLYLAQRDIMYADGKILEKKLRKSDISCETIEGNNMPHIWPLLPVMKEAKKSLQQIIQALIQ